jgi:hypothetical protein
MMPAAQAIPLPARRYLPGVNERHPEDAFDHVKALCAERTDEPGAARNTAWHYGLRLFNGGFYWEAHEVLEEVWRRARPNSRERYLVQCVIHLANGALKLSLGRTRAAVRLSGLADECRLRAFSGGRRSAMGLDGGAVEENCEALSAARLPTALSTRYEL